MGIVLAGGNATPILKPFEHDLDVVSAFAAALVVADKRGSGLPTGYAGRDALGRLGVHHLDENA